LCDDHQVAFAVPSAEASYLAQLIHDAQVAESVSGTAPTDAASVEAAKGHLQPEREVFSFAMLARGFTDAAQSASTGIHVLTVVEVTKPPRLRIPLP
jgi:hypothetical protein